jgi:soluble lytic murein transglycosylase-like protein
VRLGVRYLAQLIERFGGDLEAALTAYNWGPTRVSRMLQRGQKLPSGYAQSVLSVAEHPQLGA